MRVKYTGPAGGWFGKLSTILNSHHFSDTEWAHYRQLLDLEYGSTVLFNEITGLVASRGKAERLAQKALPA